MCLLARRGFALIVLSGRGEASKDVELLVLRHEAAVLRRQVCRHRIVRPATLLRWHRSLAARHWTYCHRTNPGGRPPTAARVRALVLRLASENATWGYRRIDGELTGLGVSACQSTVWNILRKAGVDPAPVRAENPVHVHGAASFGPMMGLLG
jgi:putative transposase